MKKQLRAYGFRCSKCEWSGMWPVETRIVKNENGVEITKWLLSCPKCRSKVIEIEN